MEFLIAFALIGMWEVTWAVVDMIHDTSYSTIRSFVDRNGKEKKLHQVYIGEILGADILANPELSLSTCILEIVSEIMYRPNYCKIDEKDVLTVKNYKVHIMSYSPFEIYWINTLDGTRVMYRDSLSNLDKTALSAQIKALKMFWNEVALNNPDLLKGKKLEIPKKVKISVK